MPDIVDEKHREYVSKFIETLAVYKKFEDMINLGAYKEGTNPKLDYAMKMLERLREYLRQGMSERVDFSDSLQDLYLIFDEAEKTR
jgi:flagellum-specific ATP synthase